MFAREERERKDCDRVSVSVSNSYTFVCFSFEETEERASCTRVEEASDMQARRNDAVWGPLSPQKPNTAPFWGPVSPKCPNTAPFWEFLFPPKSPTRHRFGHFYFPPKAHTTPFWGPTFPPNCPRWTGLLSSFFFGLVSFFFSYFGLV
jgi:hypothetical protein